MFAAACASSMRPAAVRTRYSTKDLVQRSKPAIVRIVVKSKAGVGAGTGFVIAPDGRIATNLHVILGAEEAVVTLLDGTELAVREIAAFDVNRDLAIIKVAAERPLPALVLGDSDSVSAGEPVVAIGNPLGVLDYTVSDGLISSVRLVDRSLTLLQITAPISQGSSGGPLFNPYGEVIGVVRAFIGEGQNLNFGIPSNYLRPLLGEDRGFSLAALAAELVPAESRIRRQVPEHDVAVLSGCSDEVLESVVQDIAEAIRLGAPLYNQGNHEACFRIYEGTAIRLERELACPGVREALGQGLLRAGTEDDFDRKAWAMRDAFDGILLVVKRRQEAQEPSQDP